MDGPMSTELTKREVQELMFEEVRPVVLLNFDSANVAVRVLQVVKFRPVRGEAKGGRDGSDSKGGRPVLRDNYSFEADAKEHASEGKSAK